MCMSTRTTFRGWAFVENIIELYSKTRFSYLMYPDRLYPWDRYLYSTRSKGGGGIDRAFSLLVRLLGFRRSRLLEAREKSKKNSMKSSAHLPRSYRGPWPVLRKQFRSSLSNTFGDSLRSGWHTGEKWYAGYFGTVVSGSNRDRAWEDIDSRELRIPSFSRAMRRSRWIFRRNDKTIILHSVTLGSRPGDRIAANTERQIFIRSLRNTSARPSDPGEFFSASRLVSIGFFPNLGACAKNFFIFIEKTTSAKR